jgi:hypothetical protein
MTHITTTPSVRVVSTSEAGTKCLFSDAESPVPEGRSKSLSVPEIFVVETEFMPL